jgi:hypothetical protein
MSLPKKLKEKYLARFDELIATGENILNNPIEVPAVFARDAITGRSYIDSEPSRQPKWSSLVEWRTKSATLLSKALKKGGVHENSASLFLGANAQNMEALISILRAIKDDWETVVSNLRKRAVL